MKLNTTPLTRRGLLLTATSFGAVALAACTIAPPQEASSPAPTGPAPDRTAASGNAVQARDGLYGVGVYNTRQVADELVWIEENVQPLGGDTKRILMFIVRFQPDPIRVSS